VGFIASKKVGNAVKRNRAKRRMRALFSEFESSFVTGVYIFVAKNPIVQEDFTKLRDAFLFSMKRLNTIKR
jgi:ribonuclease P protein component